LIVSNKKLKKIIYSERALSQHPGRR